MNFPGILITNAHAGLQIPPEIEPGWLSSDFNHIVQHDNDLFTDLLYDFSSFLPTRQIIFPYPSAILNVNRHPDNLEEAAPVQVGHLDVYRQDKVPSMALRKEIVAKYHRDFHNQIASAEKELILDGHSTTDADADQPGAFEDIILDDFQQSPQDPTAGIHSAPPGIVETYANELIHLLPASIHVNINSRYVHQYGHIMATHGWDGLGEKGRRAPLLLQETNERLYIDHGIPMIKEIYEFQRVFSTALALTYQKRIVK